MHAQACSQRHKHIHLLAFLQGLEVVIAQCALQALLDDELDLEGLCTQTDDQCMPESDQPAHGIPLLGTRTLSNSLTTLQTLRLLL